MWAKLQEFEALLEQNLRMKRREKVCGSGRRGSGGRTAAWAPSRVRLHGPLYVLWTLHMHIQLPLVQVLQSVLSAREEQWEVLDKIATLDLSAGGSDATEANDSGPTDSSSGAEGSGGTQPGASARGANESALSLAATAATNLARQLRASETVLQAMDQQAEAMHAPLSEAAIRAWYATYVAEVRPLVAALDTDPLVAARIEALTLEIDKKMSG